MKISTRTEYGIRILVTLARQAGSGPVSLAGIAKATSCRTPTSSSWSARCAAPGSVSATRGHAGGYQLAREAAQIPMTDAVRALEGPLLEMPCAGADDLEACDRPQDCSVHEVFQRVFESLSGTLGSTTLAEVAASAGGPPYPPAVRKRRVAQHAAIVSAASAASAASAQPRQA